MGGFGAPDRGGSREGKKSLRGNKQALQKLIKDEQKGHVRTGPRPTFSETPPPALPPTPDVPALLDAAAQLASRQFDRDQFKVLQRAASSGVGPIVAYSTDDSKQDALVRCAKENAGQVYCMVGVHSDNIKRANDRLSPARMEQLRDLVLEPGCVAVMAGLAFRDVGIRYAQERALTEQMELAAGVGLPLVLYEVRAAEVLAERITEFRSGGSGEGRSATTPIAIFNFGGSEEELRTYLGLDCHIILTGRVCEPGERGEQLRSLAAAIPPDRLMLASDSPFATPQNIPDVFVREGRNEPSNLPFLLEALAPPLGLTAAELAAATRRTALRFFGIREAAEAEADAAAAAAAEAGAAAPAAPAAAADAAKSGKVVGITDVVSPQQQQPQQQKGAKGGAAGEEACKPSKAGGKGRARGRGSGKGAGRHEAADSEEEEEAARASGESDGPDEDEEEVGEPGPGASRKETGAAGRAANLFALMQLEEGEEGGEDGNGGGADGKQEPEPEQGGSSAEDGEGQEESRRAINAAAARAASGRGASTSGAGAAGVAESRPGGGGARPPPRNFVAEYAAAAAARGPAAGPRVTYACRGCRSVLFSEADCETHEREERGLFNATKPRKKGRGKGADSGEGDLCSMHFLRHPLPWMESCLRSEGPRLGEGKLLCPTCSAKLGKWAAGGGAGGVQCSCGVLVGPPAYALLRARLDILDSQLDIASAVQSTLQAYQEDEAAPSDSGSSDGGARGGRKKRAKQRRDKTANFSSFRNKNFGFSLKQQKQLADSVAAAGADGGGGGGAGGKLGAVHEESD